jgi:hypothetical protein
MEYSSLLISANNRSASQWEFFAPSWRHCSNLVDKVHQEDFAKINASYLRNYWNFTNEFFMWIKCSEEINHIELSLADLKTFYQIIDVFLYSWFEIWDDRGPDLYWVIVNLYFIARNFSTYDGAIMGVNLLINTIWWNGNWKC